MPGWFCVLIGWCAFGHFFLGEYLPEFRHCQQPGCFCLINKEISVHWAYRAIQELFFIIIIAPSSAPIFAPH
jgi:hypothetical protein